MPTDNDELPAQLMDRYAASLLFLAQRALGLRFFATGAAAEAATSALTPRLQPPFQARLVVLLRAAAEASPRGALDVGALTAALAGAVDDAAAERDAGEAEWAAAVETFEVAATAAAAAAAAAETLEPASTENAAVAQLKAYFFSAWASAASAAPAEKLAEVLRCVSS
jgi:hypothetical protein